MGDFLKSAFDYFGSGAKTRNGNELVGNCIEIGNQNFKIINTIAEGGFSIVLLGQDISTSKVYAVKRLLSQDAETNKEIMQEVSILKKLSSHPNIIKLITAASIGQEKQRQMGTEFLIVTEYCAGGQLIQLMQRRHKSFPYQVTIQLLNHLCKAVDHMHSQSPPIIHRDLKVENLLITDRAVLKLCDFGSATTITHHPDNSWTGLRRSEVQEEIEKHTTPMYRAPEMLDLYQNFPIDQACDIWALGCILYYLCCNKHPFEDSAKLAILNAKYTPPTSLIDSKNLNESLCGLIYQMLLIDPRQRPTISEISNEIRVQASSTNVALQPSISFDKESLTHLPHIKPSSPVQSPSKPATPTRPLANPRRPAPPPVLANRSQSSSTPNNHRSQPATTNHSVNPPTPVAAQQHQAPSLPTNNIPPNINNPDKKMLGFLKEGAGHLMKNIRDASNKVMEQVSATMNKTDLDITYVTSRILIMPTPGEVGIDTITRDRIDDVQAFLEFRHPNQYYIYNLSLRQIKSDKFKDRVYQDLTFDPMKCPPLQQLVQMLLHQIDWLTKSERNVIILQCNDGRIASALAVSSLLGFCRLVDTSLAALNIVRFRRGDCQLTPSHLRYIDYICRLVISSPSPSSNIPHKNLIKLSGLVLEPVPIFNRSRTGFRPLFEIFCDYKLVYSNIKNYDDLTVYTEEHKAARIPIPNVTVCGDVNIVMYHTRSNIVTKGKLSTMKICETQIYTGFLEKNCTEIILPKQQLDHLDADHEKYPRGFQIQLHLIVTNKEDTSVNINEPVWEVDKSFIQHANFNRDCKMLLFRDKDELKQIVISTDVKLPARLSFSNKIDQKKDSPALETTDFFTSLQWNEDTDSQKTQHHATVVENGGDSVEWFNDDSVAQRRDDLIDVEEDPPSQDNQGNNNVGDLLGDLGEDARTEPASKVAEDKQPGSVDGLMDFLASFGGSEQKQSSDQSSNLLMFDTQPQNEESLFDPFGEGMTSNTHTNISSSTSNLNSTFGVDKTTHNWPSEHSAFASGPPIIANLIKPSNSTNCLLNMTSAPPTNQSLLAGNYNLSPAHSTKDCATAGVKPSSSFTSPQQYHHNSDVDIFDTLSASFQSQAPPTNKRAGPPPPTKPKPTNISTAPASSINNNKPKDAFKDLLGDFKPSTEGLDGSSNAGKTIKEMRREQQAKTTDPEIMIINDWIDGKERNIRALLCSLNSIIWDGVRWNGVNIAELVTVDQVKRAYKNAIRAVHPDKWNNSEHENLAKLIMIELNDAMTEFEAERNAAS